MSWLKSLQSFIMAVKLCHVFTWFCLSSANLVLWKCAFSSPQICWLAQFVWWVNDFAQNITWLNYKQGIWLGVYFIKLLPPNFFLLPHPHGDLWKDLPPRGCPCLRDGGESLRVTEKQPTGSLDSCCCCCCCCWFWTKFCLTLSLELSAHMLRGSLHLSMSRWKTCST